MIYKFLFVSDNTAITRMLVKEVLLWVTLKVVMVAAVASEGYNVQLRQGTIRGTKVVEEVSRPFYTFEGIPYAKPPVGDLRFKVSYVARLIIFTNCP